MLYISLTFINSIREKNTLHNFVYLLSFFFTFFQLNICKLLIFTGNLFHEKSSFKKKVLMRLFLCTKFLNINLLQILNISRMYYVSIYEYIYIYNFYNPRSKFVHFELILFFWNKIFLSIISKSKDL